MSRPFVIAVASEKGGVGKTTIATNLAVYLKALREDLPVTIASFDNHFSVDQMFSLGSRPEVSVADLIGDQPARGLSVIGQYGVQYVPSSRRLASPPHAPAWLCQRLYSAVPEGVLILDTRPILDWFTEAALLSADLVVLPVKDRAALVNADALRNVLAGAGRSERLWLLPSLIDTRARLNAEVRVHEFIRYAAAMRDYQVMEVSINKSPKVESLASGFSSRIQPVLTHARNTAVHGQFKQLAEFVLSRFDAEEIDLSSGQNVPPQDIQSELSDGQLRRLVLECPLCCRQSLSGHGHFYFDIRSRRRGFIHPACFSKLRDGLNLGEVDGPEFWLALTIDGPGLVGPDCRLTVHLCGADGELIESEEVGLENNATMVESLSAMTGRSLDEAYRELILVNCTFMTPSEQLAEEALRSFVVNRRQVARELHRAGLFA